MVVLAVTTRIGGVGAINVYQQYGQAVYLLPYAVLAVPVATAAFPRLARQAADGDRAAFARTSAVATRGLLVASVLGAGMLVAAAPAAQRLFTGLDAVGGPALASLADGVTALAVGLPGWALVALGGRGVLRARPGPGRRDGDRDGLAGGRGRLARRRGRAARRRPGPRPRGRGRARPRQQRGHVRRRRAAPARPAACGGPEALAGVRRTFLRTAAAALARGGGRPAGRGRRPARPAQRRGAAAGGGRGGGCRRRARRGGRGRRGHRAGRRRLGPAPRGSGAARGAEPPVGAGCTGAEPPVGVLLVLATSGGGTGRHVAELARGLAVSSPASR